MERGPSAPQRTGPPLSTSTHAGAGEPLSTTTEVYTPGDAMAEITKLEDVHEALKRRTVGLSWMVWGIVAAAIFVSYSFVGFVAEVEAPEAATLFPFLWLPWVLLGVLTNRLLWRSVGLVIALDPAEGAKWGILTMVLFLGLIFGGMALVAALDVPITEPATVLMAMGLATGLLGAVGGSESYDRGLALAGGAVLVVVALAATLLVGDGDTAYAWFSLVAPVAVVLVNFTVGGLVASRG